MTPLFFRGSYNDLRTSWARLTPAALKCDLGSGPGARLTIKGQRGFLARLRQMGHITE